MDVALKDPNHDASSGRIDHTGDSIDKIVMEQSHYRNSLRTPTTYFLTGSFKSIIYLSVAAVCLALLLGARPWSGTRAEMQGIHAVLDGTLWFDQLMDKVKWSEHLTSFLNSSAIVLISLTWSTVLSMLIGYKLAMQPHSSKWDIGGSILTFVSGVPFLVVGLLAIVWLKHHNESWQILKIPLAGIILGTCEGGLAEWPRHYRGIIEDLQKKTFFLAYRARGQNVTGLILRHIKPYFLQTLPTRVSYLFSGLVVIEMTMEINGLGNRFIDLFLHPDRQFAYRGAMITAMLIILIPVLVRSFVSPGRAFRK